MSEIPTHETASLAPRNALPANARRRIAGPVALIFSLLACYGTLAAVALLSALGVTLAVNPDVWAGAIVLFAAVATAIVGLGVRQHGSVSQLIPALAGTVLLGYVMFVSFDRVLEVIAFALLAGAVYWDYRLRGRVRHPQPQ